MGDWTVFSNHGHVLVCLANNNEARLRDVASAVGITERAVQKIVRELQQGGFISISKHGRCNRYDLNTRKNLRHPLQSSCTVGVLLKALSGSASSGSVARTRQSAGKAVKPLESVEKPAAETEIQAKPKSAAGGESKGESGTEPTTAAATESKPAEETAGKRGKKADTRQQGSLF